MDKLQSTIDGIDKFQVGARETLQKFDKLKEDFDSALKGLANKFVGE